MLARPPVPAFNRHLSPYPKGDVRYVSTPEEDVAEIGAATLDQARQFYRDFYGASNATLTVVGDFDPKEISGLAQQLFGDWKSPRPFTRVPSVYRDVAASNQSFPAPDKANAFFVAGFNVNLRDDNPDYPALVLGNYMLGGGFLNSRLATRIRQKEGLSYGVGSGLNVSSLDRSGRYLFLGRTLQWDADLEARIKALTPEQINAAMRKYIDPSKITIIKSGDFAKAAAATK